MRIYTQEDDVYLDPEEAEAKRRVELAEMTHEELVARVVELDTAYQDLDAQCDHMDAIHGVVVQELEARLVRYEPVDIPAMYARYAHPHK